MSFYSVKSSGEIVPEQCDEPLGSKVGFPVLSDQFYLHLSKRTCLLVDPDEFLVLFGSGVVLRIHSLRS